MKDIVKVIIKGESGYFCDERYNEKLTISQNSISYEYVPRLNLFSENVKRKWSFKTDNILFKNKYDIIAKIAVEFLNKEPEMEALDIGAIEIILKDLDNKKYNRTFFVPVEYFASLFNEIKDLIPQIEEKPNFII